jgi:hypothetical protein
VAGKLVVITFQDERRQTVDTAVLTALIGVAGTAFGVFLDRAVPAILRNISKRQHVLGPDGRLTFTFYVWLGDRTMGPISFSVRKQDSPKDLTSGGLNLVLNLSPKDPSKQWRLYSRKRRRFLRPDKPYLKQGIGPEDTLMLTDNPNTEWASGILETLVGQKKHGVPETCPVTGKACAYLAKAPDGDAADAAGA